MSRSLEQGYWHLLISGEERQRLLRLAARLCNNHADAEDAVQDALATATKCADQLRDHSKRWGWLCKIVTQQCQLQYRKQRPSNTELVEDTLASTQPQTSSDLRDTLHTLVKQLPDKQRMALTLRHMEQMEYESIAAVMKISTNTARSHVKAAREKLHDLIVHRFPEWTP